MGSVVLSVIAPGARVTREARGTEAAEIPGCNRKTIERWKRYVLSDEIDQRWAEELVTLDEDDRCPA